jgi:hypothetical protein
VAGSTCQLAVYHADRWLYIYMYIYVYIYIYTSCRAVRLGYCAAWHTRCLPAAEVPCGAAIASCCGVLWCAVLRRWVFLGEGLPSIAFALMLPCLLPGSPGKMRSSRWLSHAELQLLRADVSLAGSLQQL